MLGYGVKEYNPVDVHEVTAYGGFILSIKHDLGYIWYYGRFHLMDLVVDCFDKKILNTGSIDILIYPKIFSQNWDIL